MYYNSIVRENYINYPGKKFLTATALARREAISLNDLNVWCEMGDLRARQINDQWFIDLDDWKAIGPHLVNKLNFSLIRNVYSPIILITIAALLIVIIAWTPLQTRFQAGSTFLTTAVTTVSKTIVQNPVEVRMASVYDKLWIKLERFWLGFNQLLGTTAGNLIYFWGQALDAWQGFFGQENTILPPVALPLNMDSATLETMKAEIKAELLRELKLDTNGSTVIPSGRAPGLVVLPSSGDPIRDEALKLELKNTFSDQVEVKFDPSGQAGVITPIFRSGRGDNYLFILTPLNRRL